VDSEAEFYYVPKEKVLGEAERLQAIPYDIPGVEYSHQGDECTFDFIVKKHLIMDEAIARIATIVRGADTHRFDIAEQSAGLWAISAGLSVNFNNDYQQLEIGMIIYDALYSWAKYASEEVHTWSEKK
jgi:hypothetical protein